MDPEMVGTPQSGRLSRIEDYEALVGAGTVERILKKAAGLGDLHVVNVNSTYYGGGVAEMLSSLTLLMNLAGIRTGWRVIQGRPDFFSVTTCSPWPSALMTCRLRLQACSPTQRPPRALRRCWRAFVSARR